MIPESSDVEKKMRKLAEKQKKQTVKINLNHKLIKKLAKEKGV